MWEDPIVSEVRRIREQMLKEAGNLEALVKKLQESQKKHGNLLIKGVTTVNS
ncbi:MAG: hypothetical protein ACPL5F_06430 [Moorellaceae bacterium]